MAVFPEVFAVIGMGQKIAYINSLFVEVDSSYQSKFVTANVKNGDRSATFYARSIRIRKGLSDIVNTIPLSIFENFEVM